MGADRGLLVALDIPSLKLADIPEGDLEATLSPLLGDDRNKAALVIKYIEERAGLLLGQGPSQRQRQFTFPHRTFQEFLAGCHLARANDFSEQAQGLARENPAHWREVLTFAAGQSPVGAEGLGGNVWEWRRSLWGKESGEPEFRYPYDPDDGRERLDTSAEVRRVLRGGSWFSTAYYARCAIRGGGDPGYRLINIGFRVVASPF